MASFRKSTILAALAGAASVSAHGHVSKVVADGVSYTGFDPTSAPYGPQPDSITWSNGATDNGFVLSSAVGSADIICHLDATNAALTAPVTAGSNVSITWNQWPDSHHGPVIDYLASCGDSDCSTVDKSTLKFFKIQAEGQLELGAGAGQPGKWADDTLLDTDLTWTTPIPASIKPGNYVLRHELIALHEGGTVGKTQMYPQCINLKITGSGTEAPEGTLGTALYTETEAGINYNIYNDETKPTYPMPGPAMPSFGSGSGSSGDATATAPAPTTAASSTGAAAEPTTSASSAVAPTSSAVATSEATTAPSAAPTTAASSSSAATTPEPVASESAAATSTASSKSATPTKATCAGRRKRRNQQRRQLKTRLH
ncbi:hypothetical protein SLS62_003331 [Diatrype stigma]|uniref:lytic cellulose monooxygenase (C4-dehydrogenating) n=1 Tax=Diatrype stigma TaxID=117547 RepID=A0AAN9UWG2_9PEZI